MPLEAMFHAEKAIATVPVWSQPEPETDFVWFLAPLEINGVVEANFVLFGGANHKLADRNVIFELQVGAPGQRKKIPLARVEWRSIKGGHSNRRRGGNASSERRVSDTHYHSFEANWVASERRMRSGNLPQAVGLEEEPQSFESLREVIGNLFRINNISIVPKPPWEYNLFTNG
jgi:hypothetical protein